MQKTRSKNAYCLVPKKLIEEAREHEGTRRTLLQDTGGAFHVVLTYVTKVEATKKNSGTVRFY